MPAGDRAPGLAMLAAGFVGGVATLGLIWSVSTRPVAVPAPPQAPSPVRTLAPIGRAEAPPAPATIADPAPAALEAARPPEPQGTPAALPSETPVEVAPSPEPDGPAVEPATEPAPADPATTRIRINTATAAELDLLPGIGPALAARIIESRRVEGPFSGPADLERVRGIGPKTAENIAPLVRFD